MNEIKIKQVDQSAIHDNGIIGSFHPDGHDFANAEELKHWLLTGEKITKFKSGMVDNRGLTERF